MAPDGVETSMILVNGQFPGPLIEANWGDWIEVTVHNDIYGPEEATILHWHGLNQPGTPWYDGVPGVSQCPIVPGSSFTYRFRADEFGTSWWHSHQAAQYSQGLMGPIVVHGPSEYADFDVDLGPVIINDWYHDYYTDIEHQIMQPAAPGAPPPRPISQSNLVGGAGRFGDSAVPYTSWKVEAGKKYKMRLVNTGSTGFETISIDNHKLKVIANDFIPVQPYDVDFVKLAVGQRTDVVFTASGEPGESYWFRAYNDPLCGQTDGPDGRGIIAYNDADPSVEPTSTGLPIPPNDRCATDDLGLTVPLYSSPVVEPDTTITIRIVQRPDETGVFKWFMNNVVYHGNSAKPVVLTAITEDSTLFSPEETVYDTGSNKTVRLILENNSLSPHPMHLHGHDFQVLSTGAGTWDGTIRNPSNPQRRDTEMMWGGPTANPSYTVIQYEQDNPGIWALRKYSQIARSTHTYANI